MRFNYVNQFPQYHNLSVSFEQITQVTRLNYTLLRQLCCVCDTRATSVGHCQSAGRLPDCLALHTPHYTRTTRRALRTAHRALRTTHCAPSTTHWAPRTTHSLERSHDQLCYVHVHDTPVGIKTNLSIIHTNNNNFTKTINIIYS